MAVSDEILKRLLRLHPKIIDLSLDRMWRILDRLGHPERRLPPVIHVAGTNGKGSVIAFMQAAMEAAGLSVHVYTSPHLVRFHERVRLGAPGGGALISEDALSRLLEQCEEANGDEPITFFEITTAAALVAFAQAPADYLLLEVGLGGRLDATNVVDTPKACVITTIDYDHQQYLGDTLEAIAGEKAGILKPGVPAVIGPQVNAVREVLERKAAEIGAPLSIAGQDWQAFEQHGRLVFENETALMDLPLPHLPGRFQVGNAGTAIAALKTLNDTRIDDKAVAAGIAAAKWPARLQRLDSGALAKLLPAGTELWLDGGHNPSAGRAIAETFADFHDRRPVPMTLIVGMLNSKEATGYLHPFAGLAARVVTLTIPGEENALSADILAEQARDAGLVAETAASIEDAIRKATAGGEPGRVLIGGSLYLAGRVLAMDRGETVGGVSGASR